MERSTNKCRSLNMSIEKNILPRDQHIVKDHQCIDFIEPVCQWIVVCSLATRKSRAADVNEPGRAHVDNKANGIIRHRLITPISNRRLYKGLIRVRRRGFKLRTAHDNARIIFADNMKQN